MQIKHFIFNILRENTYVLYDNEKTDCVIVDPGCYYPEERRQLIDFFSKMGLTPSKILYTHCHIDHIFGASFIAETYPMIECFGHQKEEYFIDNAEEQGSMFGVEIDGTRAITHYIHDGESIAVGKESLKVLETPGHSPGGVCFLSDKDKFLLTGDLIFAGCVGRTDLYGGSEEILNNSIQTKILTLPDDVVLYPGHGGETTVGQERRCFYIL